MSHIPYPSFSGTRNRSAARASRVETRTQGVPKERGRIKIKQGGNKAKFHRFAT
jgi:hypothetical protein